MRTLITILWADFSRSLKGFGAVLFCVLKCTPCFAFLFVLYLPSLTMADNALPDQPCAGEMRILSMFNQALRAGDETQVSVAYSNILEITSSWAAKKGTTPQDAAALLQYVAGVSTAQCSRIEVRWSDGLRGVVALVKDASGKSSKSETVYFLFKYGGEYRELRKYSTHFDSFLPVGGGAG